MCGGSLIGATIGIVGMGGIGLAVAKRLIPFEVSQILYTGRAVKPEGRLHNSDQEVCWELFTGQCLAFHSCRDLRKVCYLGPVAARI